MENSFLKILERFGIVLNWVAYLCAPLVFMYVYAEYMEKYSDSETHETEIIVVSVFSGIAVWIAGAVIRYILTGRGLFHKTRNPDSFD